MEFAFSAVIVGLAAAVRRDGPTTRWTIASAVVVVVGAFFSASILISGALAGYGVPFVVGLFAAARGSTIRSTPRRGHAARDSSSVGCARPGDSPAFLRHSRPRYGFYRSLDVFLRLDDSGRRHGAAQHRAWSVRGFWAGFFGGSTLLLLVPAGLLIWFSARRWESVWWLLAAPGDRGGA